MINRIKDKKTNLFTIVLIVQVTQQKFRYNFIQIDNIYINLKK